MEIWVESAAGTVQGDGPITSADGWQSNSRLDQAGTFSFRMPAADPRAALLAAKLRAHAVMWEAGARFELGYGIIDRIELSADDPDTLTVSGSDRLGELAGIQVGDLALSQLVERAPDLMLNQGGVGAITMPAADVELSDSKWLYIGDADTFERITFDLGTDVNGTIAGWDVQFYNEDTVAWESVSIISDGTLSGGYPLGQDGTLVFDAPGSWGKYDATNYTIRLRPQPRDTEPATVTIDFTDITIWSDTPIGDALARVIELAPETTTLAVAAIATDGTITVVDDDEFDNGDAISVLLDDGTLHSTTINGAPAANVITLTAAMPGPAAIGNTVAGPTGWHLALGTNAYTATAGDVYLRFGGESLLTVLIKIAESLGEHFRLGTGRQVVWQQDDEPACGLTAEHGADPLAVEDNDLIVLWSDLQETRDATGVCSRIYPHGGGSGEDRVDLRYATYSLPAGYAYVDNADAEHIGIKRTACESWAGRIDNGREAWPEITRRSNTALQREYASNALAVKAVEWLSLHSSADAAGVPKFYDLMVTKIRGSLAVGQTIRVVAQKYREGTRYVNIDASLMITGITYRPSAAGAVVAGLQVATISRQPETDATVAARMLDRNAAAMAHVQQSAGVSGSASGVVASLETDRGGITSVTRVVPLPDGEYTIFVAGVGGTDGKLTIRDGHITAYVQGVQG